MSSSIPILNTLGVVADCWMKAESALRDVIKEKYHDLDEECVTTLFYGELGSVLHKASKEKAVAIAFLNDLRRAFPKKQYSGELGAMVTNLIADVVLHKRETERRTGGDFGLTLVRPIFSLGGTWAKGERGLLCQAKIKRRSGKWGPLQANQARVLSKRTRYLALLLYNYLDPGRQELEAFKWQLCCGMTVDQIKGSLARNQFPSPLSSKELIERLGDSSAGTSDPSTIREIIRPKGTPHLELRIFWPDGKVPPAHGLQRVVEQQMVQRIQS